MESNFLDWALRIGLKQGTIDKLTQENLNDFRALKLVDIPLCSKQLGLSLGQAAILENAVKSMLEKDYKAKTGRHNGEEKTIPRVKTLTKEQTADEYVRLNEVSRQSQFEQDGKITETNSLGCQVTASSRVHTSHDNLVPSLSTRKTPVADAAISTETEQFMLPEENTEESIAIGNPIYESIYPTKNAQKQSPLIRRREIPLNASPKDINASTCVVGVAAGAQAGSSANNGELYGEIDVKYHIVREDNKVRLITELNTEHVTSAPKVPIRFVLLVDKSGSMLHSLGQSRRYTKITQVKQFAMKLMQSLDSGDEAGIVTFGADADIFYPLTEITDDSRKKMLSKIETLDGGRMCRETNLSAGLRMALKVFKDAIKTPGELLNRKNSILIFSDGEVNAGTTDPDALVHEVRQNIRQMAPSLDDSTNQWVTISVVTTGSAVSEAAYLLSKTCSSEAYYYMDKAVNDPTAELFLPVLLRKSAVAWNVSLLIQTFNGVHFVDEECSSDCKIRLRRSKRSKTPIKMEKAYFLYDFPAGKRRQIGVTVDISNMIFANDCKIDDKKVFQIRLEYTGRGEERRRVEKCIDQLHIEKSNEQVALGAAMKHEVQLVTNQILRRTADYVKDGDQRASAVLLDGKTDIQKICNRFGEIARSNTVKHNVYGYAASVVQTMDELMKTLEGHLENKGTTWNKIKAVSSAITREAPTVSDTVKQSHILCPLPVISEAASTGFLDPMQKLKDKQLANDKESEADLEALLEDMERTIR
ncbi:hypothetical protein CHS0354_003993 [Potamilus streckersoni]|uniref:VWFA domain-containing protein n=1 Tax=Potamilus streckersoni TaxID=2493646 RepID=A0AAE0VNC3_9BIVA|nr:hypothetical protein CHS0354_003993 [Potamilus streckersoni]